MKTNENQADVVEGEVIKGNQEEDFKQRANKFHQELQALCEKYRCQLIINPAFKARDDGTFSVILSQTIGELPKTS